ncbi:hypothetical protein BD626DRAFT_516820 [Schizophyllum amplum]|uniref:Uncharacterized protein n=1 Tax=Schizophyllum amplum TaxID=97359 RepID=A0A550BWI8_9AGAR|nr:hypothetical protein BD626DRAFT_516820 [Auriculariopsis ampla]
MWVLLTATHYRLLWTRLSTHRCGVVFVALIMPEPAFKYSRRGVPHAFRTCPGRKFERLPVSACESFSHPDTFRVIFCCGRS